MDESDRPVDDRSGTDVEAGSQVELAELDRDWAASRLEVYRGLDTSVQQAIANVLQTASETRQSMEQEAKGILDRLRHERSRLVEDIREYRRQRESLAGEVADSRRRAEEEASRIRRAAEAERAQMLRDSETRRTELVAEIQRLEQQLADVSSGIQSLLQEQIGRVRADIPASGARRGRAPEPPAQPTPPVLNAAPEPAVIPTEVTAPAPAPRPEPARERDPAPRAERAPAPPPPIPARDVGIGTAATGAPEPTPVPRVAGTRRAADPTETTAGVAPADLPSVVAQTAPPPPPVPVDVPRPAPAAAPPPTRAAEPARAAADPIGPERTEIAVTNTPSFARALEFQRGIQRTEGVRQVQALQFERGTLVLAVEHDPAVDLHAAIMGLPNLAVELTGRAAGRLEFNFPAT